ncbi:C2 domain [Trinorchestia longiramus]|nr:C2 domain [Trinorchestia longiramus]
MVENCRRSHSHESLYIQQQLPRQHSASFSFSSMKNSPHSSSLYEPASPPPPLRDSIHYGHPHSSSVHHNRTLPFGGSHYSTQLPHSSQPAYPSGYFRTNPAASSHYNSPLSRFDILQSYKKTRSYDPLPPLAGEASGAMLPPRVLEGMHSSARPRTMTSAFSSHASPSSRLYNVTRTRYYLNRYRSQRASAQSKKPVAVDLTACALDDEPEWYSLASHDDAHTRRAMYVDTESASTLPSTDHLSPPSTASRLSESDMSDADLEESLHQRKMEQASLSSVGSSSSPPPDDHRGFGTYEHRSRREDPRFRSHGMAMGFGGSLGAAVGPPYKDYIPAPIPMSSRGRSQSAAPTDSPFLHVSRSRSKSPRRVPDSASRSLSPPEARPEYGGGGGCRPLMTSRSETATPTGSPKKRQLPRIPASLQHANRDKITQRGVEEHNKDLEERARHMKLRMRQMQATQRAPAGPLHSGYSDSELGPRNYDRYPRGASRGALASPERDTERDPMERDLGDSASDIESVVSGTSTFSTQSERPRGSVKHSSRQHSSSSVTYAHSLLPTDSRYSHPNSYGDDFSGVVRDQFPLPEVRLWQSETNQKPPLCSFVKNKNKPSYVPTFSAADFSTSESSPPYHIEECKYFRKKFQSRSNPAIASFQSRNLPTLHRSNTVRSFFPAQPVKHKLQKSRSIGDEFNAFMSNGSDDFSIDYRSNGAIRSKSFGDLHRYDSKFFSYDYNRERSSPAHSPPQVPCRNSDSEVECRWSNDTRRRMGRRPREESLPQNSFSDRPRPRRESGHDAGTYYGYDSEYSGAETEVFLSDRSFDRSFSQENDSDQFISAPCDCINEANAFDQRAMPGPSSLTIIERISPDLIPRKPFVQPRKLVRAKTEGSLIDYARKAERQRQEDVDRTSHSHTLPLRDSSAKKKKQVNFPFPSPAQKPEGKPQAKGIRNLTQSSRTTKQDSDMRDYFGKSRSAPSRDPYSHHTLVDKYHDQQQGQIDRSHYKAPHSNRYIYEENDPNFFRSGSSDSLCHHCNMRRNESNYAYSYDDDLLVPSEEPPSHRTRTSNTASQPWNSLSFPSKSSACTSIKHSTGYTSDGFSHPAHRSFREPFPCKTASSHESSSLPLELQLNTRVRPNSCVSINEQPQYFEFDANSPPTKEYRVIADVDPSSDPASELSDRMSGYGASGGAFGGSGKRGTFARSLSTGEVPETEKTARKGGPPEAKNVCPLALSAQSSSPVTNSHIAATALVSSTASSVFTPVSASALGTSAATPSMLSPSTTSELIYLDARSRSPANTIPAELKLNSRIDSLVQTNEVYPERDPDPQMRASSPRHLRFENFENLKIVESCSPPDRAKEKQQSANDHSAQRVPSVLSAATTENLAKVPGFAEPDEESEKGTSSTSSEKEIGGSEEPELPANIDGSLSDSAAGSFSLDPKDHHRLAPGEGGTASTPGGGSSPGKMDSSTAGLAKKSSSTSKLSDTGRKRKLGFRKKSRSTITVHRSEEILPTASRHLLRQSSSQSSEEVDSELWERCGLETWPRHEAPELIIFRLENFSEVTTVYTQNARKSSSSWIVRSEEVLPESTTGTRATELSAALGSNCSLSPGAQSRGTRRRAPGGQLTEFIEGLGPGQLVGRQVLAAPTLGDIQLSMCERKNKLEVEVIRARGLQCKAGCKTLPAPYVKVYLVDGKKCVAKAKTATARRTLDPLYQQQLIFHERYHGCVLQVTVWGDYGRMEGRKVFMGVSQIMLDDLDLSNIVIGWYKLFGTSSLVSIPTFTRRGSMVSLDSFG